MQIHLKQSQGSLRSHPMPSLQPRLPHQPPAESILSALASSASSLRCHLMSHVHTSAIMPVWDVAQGLMSVSRGSSSSCSTPGFRTPVWRFMDLQWQSCTCAISSELHNKVRNVPEFCNANQCSLRRLTAKPPKRRSRSAMLHPAASWQASSAPPEASGTALSKAKKLTVLCLLY